MSLGEIKVKKTMLKSLIAGAVMVGLVGCANNESAQNTNVTALSTYATIASVNYADALKDAKALQAALTDFSNKPTKATLQAAKDAWLVSRESYGTTEIFRLSNGPIDAEEGWVAETYGAVEGELNSWPLDENMIDYTTDANNKRTSGNIIDTKGLFTPGGEDVTAVDVSEITPDAISALTTNGGDANVAAGYHAIEFMLW